MTFEPSLPRFKRKTNIVRSGKDQIGVEGLEIVDFFNDALGIYVSHRERQGAVRHPKGGALRIDQVKKHPFILCQVGAEHHARVDLFRRRCQFGYHFFGT